MQDVIRQFKLHNAAGSIRNFHQPTTRPAAQGVASRHLASFRVLKHGELFDMVPGMYSTQYYYKLPGPSSWLPRKPT